MSFTLHVQNLRALRRVEWSPEGVCALVGANGSGKSTLLQVLRFLDLAVARGVDEAFRQVFVSSFGLRNWEAEHSEVIFVGCTLDELSWSLRLDPSGPAITWPALETLTCTGSESHSWVRLTSQAEFVRSEHKHRHRLEFVRDGLRAAFPSICGDLDFESAGPTTFVRLWPPGSELPTSISSEANGVLAMLVYLCDVASGEPGGIVAIDEPENSLHPHAIRELLAGAEAWSDAYDTTIVLATHSPVILNELTGAPERIWVMRRQAGDEPNPTRLDQLENPDWLRNFAAGTLYASGEFGSNDYAA